jgi:hypothetical protein
VLLSIDQKEQKVNKKTNKFIFLGLALLPFIILSMEMVILLIESILYGTMDLSTFNVGKQIFHWVFTMIVWCSGICAIYILSKKMAHYNVFENNNKPEKINWLIVCVLVIITAVISFIDWDIQIKPYVEFTYFTKKFGNLGILTFIVQYLYYFVESVLFLAIIIFAQEFGEKLLKVKIIPWGGIICGLTWGLSHIISKDNLLVGLLGLLRAIIYGIVYLQLKKNVRYAYIIIALMFMI